VPKGNNLQISKFFIQVFSRINSWNFKLLICLIPWTNSYVHELTNSMDPNSFWENISCWTCKIHHLLWDPKFILMFTKWRQRPLTWARRLQSVLSYSILKFYFNFILPSTPLLRMRQIFQKVFVKIVSTLQLIWLLKWILAIYLLANWVGRNFPKD
jgi:hypothetical protein